MCTSVSVFPRSSLTVGWQTSCLQDFASIRMYLSTGLRNSSCDQSSSNCPLQFRQGYSSLLRFRQGYSSLLRFRQGYNSLLRFRQGYSSLLQSRRGNKNKDQPTENLQFSSAASEASKNLGWMLPMLGQLCDSKNNQMPGSCRT